MTSCILEMDRWGWATFVFLFAAIVSFLPTLVAILRKINLKPSGMGYSESPHFSDNGKTRLNQHFSRIEGTLHFWKNEAEKYRYFHYYTLCWTIPISILIPVITQWIDQSFSSKLFLTVISLHTAVMLAFHRGFKVDKNYKSFRHGESEFYDLFRRFLDSPSKFGKTEDEQLETYFAQVETIRRFVRSAETDNFPMLEDVRAILKNGNGVNQPVS